MTKRNVTIPMPAAKAAAGTLSVCMIVKNEAGFLERCLASVRPAADQIVVVDTGSNDGSDEIARSFGAEVIRAEWKNDFAWARNLSLDRATCAWVLWLDADDVVPVSTIEKLIALKQKTADRVLGFTVRNERPDNTGTEFIQARMFPNRPEIRFERRVHEQMMPSALRLGYALESRDAMIEHHGYADPRTLKAKAQRNIALMLNDYYPATPDPVTAVEIADSYQLIEGWDKAEMWYSAVLGIAKIKNTQPAIASQACLGLGNIANRQRKYGQAVRHLEEALSLAPWRLDGLYLLAVACECAGSKEKALEHLRRILAAETIPGQVGVDFRAAKIKASLRLLRILTELQRHDEAVAEARAAVERHPDRGEIALMAAKVLLVTGELIDSIRLFEKSVVLAGQYPSVDSYIGLCCIYRKAGRMETARQTLETISPLFDGHVRYRAFRRYFLEDASVVSELFPEAKLAEEWKTVGRDFFGSV
jgi:tetratricopeptide (TPR) repeat protein